MWVSVKDRLPEEGQIVLVCAENAIIDQDPACKIDIVRLEYVSREDKEPNNKRNYEWNAIGGFDSYFGQDVYYWMIPPVLPEDMLAKHRQEIEEHEHPVFDDVFIDSCSIAAKGLVTSIKEYEECL